MFWRVFRILIFWFISSNIQDSCNTGFLPRLHHQATLNRGFVHKRLVLLTTRMLRNPRFSFFSTTIFHSVSLDQTEAVTWALQSRDFRLRAEGAAGGWGEEGTQGHWRSTPEAFLLLLKNWAALQTCLKEMNVFDPNSITLPLHTGGLWADRLWSRFWLLRRN